MKKQIKQLPFSLFLIVLISALSSCNGNNNPDEPAKPLLTTCSIISPTANEEFEISNDIYISVEVKNDTGSITEVLLYINEIEYDRQTVKPYDFVIKAYELDCGKHTLKAVIKSDLEEIDQYNTTFNIIPSKTESPDLVNFFNKEIPVSWTLSDNWDIINQENNNFQLFTNETTGFITTKKTIDARINYIEFSISGEGMIDFYVDDIKLKNCILSKENLTVHGFYLDKGIHTLQWLFTGKNIYLDNVLFKNETLLNVGTFYQGGIIAYLDETKEHGIIAANQDYNTKTQWSINNSFTVESLKTFIGSGKSNTEHIINSEGEGNYAAKVCKDLIIFGYNDWFLPSLEELQVLFKNKNLIGSFVTDAVEGKYWSSSCIDNFNGIEVGFFDGDIYGTNTSTFSYVRAIRNF